MEAIEGKIAEICMKVVRDNLLERVYWNYIPQGEYAYDRTYELMDSVTVGNFHLGTTHATFEIYMDTDKINAYVTDRDRWNQHASVDPIDVSEYIPLWVEEGTDGSLFDREGAHYMEASHYELSGGQLAQALARELRKEGWNVIEVS
jgi:hypothetical protein